MRPGAGCPRCRASPQPELRAGSDEWPALAVVRKLRQIQDRQSLERTIARASRDSFLAEGMHDGTYFFGCVWLYLPPDMPSASLRTSSSVIGWPSLRMPWTDGFGASTIL